MNNYNGKISSVLNDFEKRKFDSVIKTVDPIIENISQEKPDMIAGLFDLKGYSYLAKNDLDNAFDSFSKSIALHPDSWQCLVGLAQINYLTDNETAAIELLDKAGRFEPGKNKIELGLKNFVNMIRLKLTDELLLYKELSKIDHLFQSNRIQEAEQAAAGALILFPDNLTLLNNYAVILAIQKKFEMAGKIIDSILKYNPSDEMTLESQKIIEKLILDHKMENHPPLNIYLELNTYCNYKCIFCESAQIKEKHMISLSDIKGLDDMMKKAKMVDITGVGEITLHKEFTSILNFFTKNNVPVRFVSNGYNLTPPISDIILNSTVSELVISVNSVDREIYKKLMGIDGLDRVMKNIEYLAPRFKGNLEFSFVINKYNFGEIKNFVDLGDKYKRHVAFLGLTPKGNYPADLELEYSDETFRKVEECRAYAMEKGVSNWMFNVENQRGSAERTTNLKEVIKACDWIYNRFFVSTNGDVSPCCWSSRIMGNIYKQTFNEIWFGEVYTELRTLVSRGDPKYCYNCRRAG